MRKFQWIAFAAFATVQSVAVLGEVPATPGPDVEQMTGGKGSYADIRPGLRLLPGLRLRIEGMSIRSAMSRDDALTGTRYRKLRLQSMVDYYPISGFHLSAGFRSWKGKAPIGAGGGGAGRFNMNSLAPLLPIRSTQSNLSPMATIGYQAKLADYTQLGFEAGMIHEHGIDRLSSMPGERHQGWGNTGAIAQASVKMRFF